MHEDRAMPGETLVQVLDGASTIGGTKIAMHLASDKTILLDFGWNFRVDHDFLDGFMKLRKSNMLWDGMCIGELPAAMDRLAGLYREDLLHYCFEEVESRFGSIPGEPKHVTDVLVSHAHADHLGNIRCLHPNVRVVCTRPTRLVIDHLDEMAQGSLYFNDIISFEPMFQREYNQRHGVKRAGASKRTRISRPFAILDDGETLDCGGGGCRARPVPVDHSIPGASAWLVEDTRTGTRVVYTGDFRFHGPRGNDTEAFIEAARAFTPDVLIIEGTRLHPDGNRDEVQSEKEIEDQLATILGATAPGKLACFDCSPRDAWRLRSFYKAATSAGKTLVLDAKSHDLLDRCVKAHIIPDVDMRDIRIYLPKKGWGTYEDVDYSNSKAIRQASMLHGDSMLPAAEIAAEPGAHVVYLPYYSMVELFDLQPPSGSVYVISKSEPFNDEGLIEERKRTNWLRLFGFESGDVHHVHCSGHARRDDLAVAINTIAPRMVIPVHTEHPEEFKVIGIDAGIRIELPVNGQVFPLR